MHAITTLACVTSLCILLGLGEGKGSDNRTLVILSVLAGHLLCYIAVRHHSNIHVEICMRTTTESFIHGKSIRLVEQ